MIYFIVDCASQTVTFPFSKHVKIFPTSGTLDIRIYPNGTLYPPPSHTGYLPHHIHTLARSLLFPLYLCLHITSLDGLSLTAHLNKIALSPLFSHFLPLSYLPQFNLCNWKHTHYAIEYFSVSCCLTTSSVWARIISICSML